MIELLHTSLWEIRQTCEALASEEHGALTEKQQNKVRAIGEQAEYLSKVFDRLGELLSNNLQSLPYYEDKELFLLNLSPETRTATAFIQTSIDLLRIYHRKALETLTPDQQVSLE